jgi:hypothetical protein
MGEGGFQKTISEDDSPRSGCCSFGFVLFRLLSVWIYFNRVGVVGKKKKKKKSRIRSLIATRD